MKSSIPTLPAHRGLRTLGPRLAACLSVALALAAASGHAAESFAPEGTRLALTVEMRFDSAGKRQNKIDLFEWKGLRKASFTMPLTALKPGPISVITGPDAAQQAQVASLGGKADKVAATMGTSMEAMALAVERCGDNEACQMREAMKMAQAMQAGGQKTARAVDDVVQAARPGAARYQEWQAGAPVQGRYEVDEFMHTVHGDPICMGLPRQRCTRDEFRKGQGGLRLVPSERDGMLVGGVRLEWDSRQASLTLRLPTLGQAPALDSVKTDEPAGTHSMPGMVWLKSPDLAAEAVLAGLAQAVPAPAGPRGLAGERVVKVAGADGAGGTLTVRWRIEAAR